MIAIVNYGLGNVKAIANIYHRLSIPVRLASTAEDLRGVSKIILPGVGAFDWAMALLNQSGIRECLDDLVLKEEVPVLGICVGMQIMAHSSEEGLSPGLGWIDAEVKKFAPAAAANLQLPHMGWNDVTPVNENRLFADLESSARFYFLHSYHVVPNSASTVLAVSDYHGEFVASTARNNIFGVQFHPEKSHGWGIRLLQNFGEM